MLKLFFLNVQTWFCVWECLSIVSCLELVIRRLFFYIMINLCCKRNNIIQDKIFNMYTACAYSHTSKMLTLTQSSFFSFQTRWFIVAFKISTNNTIYAEKGQTLGPAVPYIIPGCYVFTSALFALLLLSGRNDSVINILGVPYPNININVPTNTTIHRRVLS